MESMKDDIAYNEYKNLRCKLSNILIDFLDHEGELVQFGEFDNEFMEYKIDDIINLFKEVKNVDA